MNSPGVSGRRAATCRWSGPQHATEAMTQPTLANRPPSPGGRESVNGPVPSGLAKPARELLERLVQIQLLDVASVREFLQKYRDRLNDLGDPTVLGEALVQVSLLTEYQLNRIQAGTTHGLVLGPYRVLNRLGGGSVGVVFLAEHILLRRRVAIKVVPVDEGFPQSVLERFYAEMRVLADLRHPHVVLAYDAGRLA